ncbi:recombinase family protein [Chloroflexota bacterium]
MKIAAIWARVSSPGQTSIPDQIARAKGKANSEGLIVPQERILSNDWTSLDLFNCPEFQRLYGWVRRKEISAIVMLDRDRLHSEPEQRLTFLAECKQASVELLLCQGPPMIEGDMGILLEHVYAISKKQQIMRAKMGAKDGMHDKVTKDRKPTTRHRVYGYKWETECKLVPNDN